MNASISSASLAIGQPRPVRLRSPRGGLWVDGRYYRGGVYLPATAAPALEVAARKAAAASVAEVVTLGILGFAYRVERLAIDPSIGTHAFSLHDTDRNRLYAVHRDNAGEVECDCPDFTFRRIGSGQPCKHVRRLAELGLIPSTTPRVLPPLADRRPAARPRRFEPGPDDYREAAVVLGWH